MAGFFFHLKYNIVLFDIIHVKVQSSVSDVDTADCKKKGFFLKKSVNKMQSRTPNFTRNIKCKRRLCVVLENIIHLPVIAADDSLTDIFYTTFNLAMYMVLAYIR